MTIELEPGPNRAYRGGSYWHEPVRARGDYRYADSPGRQGAALSLRFVRRCS